MVTEYFKSFAERLLAGFWAFKGLNRVVYNSCVRYRVKYPDIPVKSLDFYGQCGEDLIVLSLLEGVALTNNYDLKHQRYLEIGGNHPYASSATLLLNERTGMSGVIVEANPRLIPNLKRCRSTDTIVHGAVQTEDAETAILSVAKRDELSSIDQNFIKNWGDGTVRQIELVEVPALRMDKIIRDYLGDTAPCFLSIDVEGIDLTLLRDLDFSKYRPWIVQVEPSDDYAPGNSASMIELMRSRNYDLVAKTPVNLIFRDNLLR